MSAPALPGVLAEIAAVAGRDVALELALTFGGKDVYISARGAHAGTLGRLVGVDAWAAILERLGGESVHIPLARRALVVWLAERGVSTVEIAKTLHITQRTARRYRRESVQ